MAFSLREFPTISQALTLAALVPESPPEPPEARTVLFEMLQLCRLSWVCDFLFKDDRAYLYLFDAPLQRQFALSCSVSITSVESPAKHQHALDSHMNGSFVFVPAFSVDNISVGFGVQEYVIRVADAFCNTPSDAVEPNTITFRYVRDDLRGVLLIIHELPQEGAVKVEYMSHQSSTRRKRLFAKFNREELYAALRSDRGILHPDDIINSLTLLQTVDEYRSCPICGLVDGECAQCQLDFRSPAHPLDFNNSMRNMVSHVGAFYGVTNSVLMTKGSELLSALQGSRIRILGDSDPDLINRLSHWAITKRLSKDMANPVASIMPQSSSIGMFDCTSEYMMNEGVQEVEMIDLPEEVSSEALIDPILDLTDGAFELSHDDESQHLLTSSLYVDQVSDAMALMSDSNESVECIGIVTGSIVGKESAQEAVADSLSFIGSPVENSSGIGREKVNVVGEERKDSMESIEGVGQQAVADSGENAASALSLVGGGSARVIRKRRSASPVSKEVLDEKERKAELRRQRNREAAQRSNQRRKEKNDSLREELKNSHMRADELRQKESALRAENVKLRQQLLQRSS